MLMPMVWTNDFDEMMDDLTDMYDPFDDVISLVDTEPTKDEIASEKSIERHARKEGRRYGKALRHTFNQMNRQMNQMMKKNAMKTDVVEDGDHFTVKADLPGFDKKDIGIGLKNGILTVTASHTDSGDEKDEKTGRYLRRERSVSSYQRSFEVGDDVKPEEINAKYENGVLTLTVPNKHPAVGKEEDTKQIEVH